MSIDAMRPIGVGLLLRARLCLACGYAVATREKAVRGLHLLADRSGFTCVQHRRPLDVTDVRRVGRGIVLRYRQCPDCTPCGHVCPHGPARPGVPMVRTEERADPAGCTTSLAVLSRVCQGD